MERPNILLIHSDQHRYDCVGSHNLREGIHTPNLDQLAAEGATFSRAFATIPICTPARASLMTGAWPHQHGSFTITQAEVDRAARPEFPLLTELLSSSGYRVSWTGKYHGETVDPPGEGRIGVTDYRATWDYKAHRERLGIPELVRKNGYFGTADLDCPADLSPLAWQADQVIEQIQDSSEAPFFIRWDPPEPHLPCEPSRAYAEKYQHLDLSPWPSFGETLAGKPEILRRQRRIWDIEGWDWEKFLPTVRLYHAIIEELDANIGRVLAKLDELGLTENTLVIYSTDHGDFCGGHGLMDKQFCMYEDIMRVPLIARWPGVIPARTNPSAFVSNSIDIARTIVSSAGISPPDTFVGQDLLQICKDASYPSKKYAFAQYFGTQTGLYSCRMIRDERYKFVYHPTGSCHEFYDLEADPGELQNLIASPQTRSEEQRLRRALWNTMTDCGDRLASFWTEREILGPT